MIAEARFCDRARFCELVGPPQKLGSNQGREKCTMLGPAQNVSEADGDANVAAASSRSLLNKKYRCGGMVIEGVRSGHARGTSVRTGREDRAPRRNAGRSSQPDVLPE